MNLLKKLLKTVLMFISALALSLAFVSSNAFAQSGAIWTTDQFRQNQNVNSFFLGQAVWLAGSNMSPSTSLAYEITDGTGASAPVIQSGFVDTDALGDITPHPVKVWDIPINYVPINGGQFKVKVYDGGTKSDNFSVAALATSPDYGDAPDPTYPSLEVNNGASHLDITMEWLGTAVDGEADSAQVDLDNFDDGVVINGIFEPAISTSIDVLVNTSGLASSRYDPAFDSALLYLNAWADWNGDGDWNDPDEKIIGTGSVVGQVQLDPNTFGGNSTALNYNITPPSLIAKSFYLRFRLDFGEDAGFVSTSGVSEMTGRAMFGEVEDYAYNNNLSPVIDSYLPVNLTPTMNEADSLDFSVTASDANPEDTLTYSWLLDIVEVSTTNAYTYTPGYLDAGVHTVDVIVSDGNGGTDSRHWDITVNNLNRQPTIDSYLPLNLTPSVDEGGTLPLSITSSDPDTDDTLTYSWLLDSIEVSTSSSFDYNPDFFDAGLHTIDATVNDGKGGLDTQHWDVTVNDVNNLPDTTVDALPASIATTSYTITGTATDPDGAGEPTAVKVQIQRQDNSQYWNGAAWQVGAVEVDAANTGVDFSTWEYAWNNFGSINGVTVNVQARAFDGIAYDSSPASDSSLVDNVANNLPDTTVDALPASITTTSYTITGTATDPDGAGEPTAVKVQIQRQDNSQYWNGTVWQAGAVEVDAANTDVDFSTWQYAWNNFGSINGITVTIQARAFDGIAYDSAPASDSTLVNNVNDPPVTTVDSLPAAITTTSYTITGTASDPDGPGEPIAVKIQLQRQDNAQFWNGAAWQPVAVEVDATNTGVDFSTWEYNWVNFGSINGAGVAIQARAFDGIAYDSSPTVESSQVDNVPNPPTIDLYSPVNLTPNVDEGSSLGFSVTASDPDPGDTLTYSWLLDGVEVSTTTDYTYSPGFSDAGIHTVDVTVSDGNGGSDTQHWDVTVTDVNLPPAIDSYSPVNLNPSVEEGNSLPFSVTASDPDPGDSLTYSWLLDSVEVSTESSYTYNPGTGDAGAHTLDVNIDDGKGGTESQQWNINVTESAPTLIELVSFTAIKQNGTVLVNWTTVSEIDNAGFNLWKSSKRNGNFMKINSVLIPAAGSPVLGANYTFTDTEAGRGPVYYYLEDIDFNGTATWHGEGACTLGTDPDCQPVRPRPLKGKK